MVIYRINRVTDGVDREWWECGEGGFHDINQFDLDAEECAICGMDIEEYWAGYSDAISDDMEHLSGAQRIRRTEARNRFVAEMHAEQGEDSSSPQRAERTYLQLGMGE